MSHLLNRAPSAPQAPVGEGSAPSVEPRRTTLDAAGIVAWLVMLALAVAFLAAVVVTALA